MSYNRQLRVLSIFLNFTNRTEKCICIPLDILQTQHSALMYPSLYAKDRLLAKK